MMWRSPWLLVLFGCSAVFTSEYAHKDPVMVYVNKVGPYENPSVTYHYYTLPVCRPEKIVHKPQSLGEILAGDRMAESLFQIKFQDAVNKTALCGPLQVSGRELLAIKQAVEEQWYFEFVIDELPVRGFVGSLEQEGVLPHEHSLHVYTHYAFEIEYNAQHIIAARVDMQQERPVSIGHDDTQATLQWTYSVKWTLTRTAYENRKTAAEEQLVEWSRKHMQIHWLSVLNSCLLTVMLVLFVFFILVRTVRNDLVRYNEAGGSEKADAPDNGWKSVSGDVFRFPNHRNALCAVLGVGYQLLAMALLLLLFGTLDWISANKRGQLYKLTAQLYGFTSCVAGYTSARYYRMLNGERWLCNVHLTSATFARWYSRVMWLLLQTLPLFTVWAVLNTLWWIGGSTRALPYETVVLLLAVWLFFGYPLTFVSGVLGRRFASPLVAPCRTRLLPRELPRLPFYQSLPFYCLGGGFLSFSSISVELYYVLSSIWGRQVYTIYYIILISVAILLLVTACTSVAITYFQLQSEDYRWWWRSLATGGATGVYVFVYSVYFYFGRSEMSGSLQLLQFFGYAALLSYGFSLALAAVSFISSYTFVNYIYASVKTD